MALPGHAAHGGGVRNPHIERLRIAKGRLAALGHAHHAARHLAQQNHFAHRVGVAREKLLAGVVVNDHFLRQAGHAVFVKGAAGGQLHATHPEILLAHTIDGAVHGDVAVTQRGRAADTGRDTVHITLLSERGGIAGHQGAHTRRALVTKAGA